MKGKAGYAGLTATLVRVDGTAVDLSAKEGVPLPRRMKILNLGENPNARGKRVFVGTKLVRALSAPTYPFRKIPLDFEHNTLSGTPAYAESKEPRKIAAFCSVELAADGVYLCVESWTPDGVEHAANYCDLSAAPVTDAAGEVVAILSAALCRCGAVEGMDFKEVAVSLSATALAALNPTTEDDVNWKQIVCQALGMDPETATDEQIVEALKKALGGKEMDETALNAVVARAVGDAVTPLNAQVKGLGDQFAAELLKRDKQSLLDQARQAGKVVALNAEAVAALSLSALQEHVAALAVTVPLNARTPATVPEKTASAGPDEAQRAIALNCGCDPDAVWPKKQ
jgi:hypothetical protein